MSNEVRGKVGLRGGRGEGGTGGLAMSSCVIRRQRLALRPNWTELCWVFCKIIILD